MKKRNIEVSIDFLRRPILLSDLNTGKLFTGISAVDNNKLIEKLNKQIGDTYDDYYEFDSHDQGCWFNEEQFKKDRAKLLAWIKELVDELNRVCDGSYVVVDKATEYISTLMTE